MLNGGVEVNGTFLHSIDLGAAETIYHHDCDIRFRFRKMHEKLSLKIKTLSL